MRARLLLAIVVALAAPAAADPDGANGFFTSGVGELRGTVTDASDKPLAKVDVHVVSASGTERVVVTDQNGAFRVDLRGGGMSSVFVRGGAHLTGQLAVPAAGDNGEEVIEIHEVLPPATPPKSLANPLRIPDYTDEARDKDVWTRAWLMLDISATGTVTRVALLDAPGFGLDEIAVRDAFKLTFEPARDRSKRPVDALTLYTFEWPAYWWMMDQHAVISRMPGEAMGVPCRSATRPRPHERDCRKPSVAKAASARWIERPPAGKR
jgi:Carboxypeptidase regulatory-like domain